jgi:hypothetical protein
LFLKNLKNGKEGREMKRIFILTVMMAMVLGFSVQAHATLILKGTDSLGNRLIYDTDLDITWYDYTSSPNPWQNQVNWADALSVTFGGNTYTDWRLPTTVDGPYTYGYDGTTTAGYNITSSEMGHLFYTELGNAGWYDTSGNLTGCSSSSPWCLTNTGDFQNLQPNVYWSGTEYAANPFTAWHFDFIFGYQYNEGKGLNYYAIAVRPGDVSAVPEPGTMLLLGTGLAGLIVFRKRPGRIHG